MPFEERTATKKRINVLAIATINPFLKRSKRVCKEVKVKQATLELSQQKNKKKISPKTEFSTTQPFCFNFNIKITHSYKF